MSNDTLKNRIRISTTLFPETKQKLNEFHNETQIPITTIIENAILEYISKNGER